MPTKPLAAVPSRIGRSRRLDRDAVVAAAAEIVDRDGVDGLTLAALATALGIKAPSLYAHIEGLRELKAGVALLGLRELAGALAGAALGLAGADALRAMCGAYRGFAERRPGLYLGTVIWAPLGDAPVRDAGQALTATLLKILFAADPERPREDQIHALRMIYIALHGFVTLRAAAAFGEPVDPDETFRRLVERLTTLIA